MENGRGKLWFHVASVGEFNTARPVLKKLYQDYHVVLTYFSFRARDYLTSQRDKGYFHELYRMPLDLPPLVKSFERRLKPMAIIVMERELWPCFLTFTRAPKIWLNAYAKGGLFERWLSRKFSLILTRDEESFNTFQAYGCKKVVNCQNLKFVLEEPKPIQINLEGELFVAGSTHPGEEAILKEVFQRLKEEFKDLKLAIAPRHVGRATEVAQIFKDYKVSFRSKEEKNWDVLIVDTLGELFSLYAHARLAFVGGTLVPVGGHNLLEPAYFGKPVLYGPYTHKVEDLRQFLERVGMGFAVKDAQDLYKKAKGLILGELSFKSSSLREYSNRVLQCYLSHLEEALQCEIIHSHERP